jgi:hypothetical protein
LTQPGKTTKLTRLGVQTAPVTPPAYAGGASGNELAGKYSSSGGKATIEIRESGGTLTFNIAGQPPYTLKEKSKDTYSLDPLPETYWLKTKRDAAGKVEGVVVTQPEGEVTFARLQAAPDAKPAITVDELAAKTVEAVGGEANWLKLKSRVVDADVDFINQGVKATTHSYAMAPNKTAAETSFTALGKTIGDEWEYFDGESGADLLSFAPLDKYTGKRLEDVRLAADFYSPLHWKTNYKKIEITGTAKVGDQEAYVVVFEPEKGTNVTEYYSTTTFLLLKREGIITSSTSSQLIPYSIVFSDYRAVDGVKLAFKTVNSNIGNGEIVMTVRSVKHNVPIDEKTFGPGKLT